MSCATVGRTLNATVPLQFVRGFRAYSPFNATVVRIQSPGATYVASTDRWLRDYDRAISPGARPLMILQPRGPVMFVYDVADTEPLYSQARPLPKRVTDPFAVTWHGDVVKVMARTVGNAARDGIRVTYTPSGASQAGCAMPARAQGAINFVARRRPERVTVAVQVRYDVVINDHLDAPAQYATLLHELAHIYCGHLGTPNEKWWPRGTCSRMRKTSSRPSRPPISSPAASTPPFNSRRILTNTSRRTARSLQ